MRRRTGFTMIELLFAAALVAVVLLGAYALLHAGLRGGAHAARSERADALSRGLLALYSQLPQDDLEHLFRDEDTIAPERFLDQLGDTEGFDLRLSFRPLPGEVPTQVLRTRVSWTSIGGHRRSVKHRRYLSYGNESERTAKEFPGFRRRGEMPGWGRTRRWRLDSQDMARRAGADRPGLLRSPDEEAPPPRLDELVQRAAADAVYDPDAYYAKPVPQQVVFHGDPGIVEELGYGPGGAATGRVPPMLRARQEGAAHRRSLFLGRTGLDDLADLDKLEGLEIPDGVYPYRLEALDQRDRAGMGRVVGVYVLRGKGVGYDLVSTAHYRPRTIRTFSGDEVLETRLVRDAGYDFSRLYRTEERLYLVSLADDLPTRKLELATLPDFDGGRQGTSRTRKFVERFLLKRELVEVDGQVEDELLASLVDDLTRVDRPAGRPLARGAAGKSGQTELRTRRPGCEGGTCPAGQVAWSTAWRSGGFESYRVGKRRGPGGSRVGAGGAPSKNAVTAALEILDEDPAEALRRLDAHLAENPDDHQARLLRGRLRGAEGDAAGATEDLERVSHGRALTPAELRDLTGFQLRAWKPDEAEQTLKQLEQASPGDPLVQTFRESLKLVRSGIAGGMNRP